MGITLPQLTISFRIHNQSPDKTQSAVERSTTDSTEPAAKLCQTFNVHLIPKVRHVISPRKTLASRAQSEFEIWLRKEPDWKHTIHTDADCLILADRFEAERSASKAGEERHLLPEQRTRSRRAYHYNFSQVYRDYQLNVMRADACRVLAVYFSGGMYMDLDVVPRAEMHTWWAKFSWSSTDLILAFETLDGRISNYLFGATARHPCLRWVLESMLRAGQDPFPFNRTAHAVHVVTGPDLFSRAINECRLHPSYFASPRVLADTRGGTLACRLEPSTGPYTEVAVGGEVWYAPKVLLSYIDVHGAKVHHQYASVHWKRDSTYASWTEQRESKRMRLAAGDPVDALGRKDWAVQRYADDDELLPTLIPKVRHVVLQHGATAESARVLDEWRQAEPHFVAVVHSASDCAALLGRFTSWGGNVAKVHDELCGLLAVHYFGGIYMDSRLRPKVRLMEWTGVNWATTDLLLAGVAAVYRVRGGLETTLFGAVSGHPCVDRTLALMMERAVQMQHEPLIFSSRLAKGMLQCTLSTTDVAREQTVHYVRGFTHDGVRAEWLSRVKGGGRRVQDGYSSTTSGFVPRPLVTSEELRAAVNMDALPTAPRAE